MNSLAEQRNKNMKDLQEKTKLNEKEVKNFNPVSSCLVLPVLKFSFDFVIVLVFILLHLLTASHFRLMLFLVIL